MSMDYMYPTNLTDEQIKEMKRRALETDKKLRDRQLLLSRSEAPVVEEKKSEESKEENKGGWTGGQIAGTVLGLLFLLLVFYMLIWPAIKN